MILPQLSHDTVLTADGLIDGIDVLSLTIQ